MRKFISVCVALLMASMLEVQRYLGVDVQYIILSIFPLGLLGLFLIMRIENKW